jgi:hypothetical protein
MLISAVACKASSTDESSVVGEAGGTVTLADGAVVQIPAGALAQSVAISIGMSSTAPAAAVGHAYLFGPEGQTFTQPVLITLPFSPDQVPAGATVEIQTAPAGSTAFTSLSSSLVDASHVQASTTHFSIFSAVAGSVSNGADFGLDGGSDAATACRGAAQACSSPSDCCSQNCSNAVCSAATSCPSGLTLCNGACKSLSNDPANCGGCGKVCPINTPTCVNSQCGAPTA